MLMGNEKADMIYTDPPYNVAYAGAGKNKREVISNDDMPPEKFAAFLESVFSLAATAVKKGATVYVSFKEKGNRELLSRLTSRRTETILLSDMG